MISIRQADPSDVNIIREIANETWWPTYSPILTHGQIAYMLELFYSAEAILQQMQDGHTYLLLQDEAEVVGFASFSPRVENNNVYKLHRLYCLPKTKGKGHGKALIFEVEQQVILAGKTILELNVNINNPAKQFYERMGYHIAYNEQIDIGNGYIMDDHVMRKYLMQDIVAK